MKIELMAVGRVVTRYLQEGIDVYTSRIGHYMPFSLTLIPDVKTTKGLTQEKHKEMEGKAILSQLQAGDVLVLLDEHGKEMTSREFATYIDRKSVTVARRLVFLIGGPYGFSPEIYERANEKISLSRMTFSHEMVRLFFVEQIYRAMTILRGEPYHHD